MLGMPSNQAKDAVAYTPRAVLLKARKFITVGAQGLSIGFLTRNALRFNRSKEGT